MSFSSWVFGDNDRGKAIQPEDSCCDDEVSSQPYDPTHNQQPYLDPMSVRSSFHLGTPSHNEQSYMDLRRQSFDFGTPSHNQQAYIDPMRSVTKAFQLYSARSSFHLGTPSRNEQPYMDLRRPSFDFGTPSHNQQAYIDPMSARSSLHLGTLSDKEHAQFKTQRSSFHFGDSSGQYGTQYNSPPYLEPTRSSFHFGTKNEDYSHPSGVAVQHEPSRSSFHFGTRGESYDTSMNIGGSSEPYIPAPYNEESGSGSSSFYPSASVQFTEHEMTDMYNYAGYLGHGTDTIDEEEREGMPPEHWHECLKKNKRYRRFKDCIGAIDGTHVPCTPSHETALYWSRKGGTTFNVIAVCDFNLCFTFAASGYEGIMHDYNIFKHETTKTGNRFPHPPEGKYYLVDAGYPNAKGYMAPYTGYMYHQDDFRRRRRPVRDSNERFNRVHSSLRSCVERAFGVWKARWAMMKSALKFKLEDHKKIILISMALHNYIRIHCPSDKYFRSADMENEEYENDDTISREIHAEANEAIQSDPDFAVVDEYMDSLRNEIRNQIFLDHKGRGNRQGNVMRSEQGD
ncbi:hypothetical protein Vadar_020153 [Vaccinium darrowii]|nr:hypothetical protein Vadar_020153 [Vaccinium darrowii]